MPNHQLAAELHKPIIRKRKHQKLNIYTFFKEKHSCRYAVNK